MLGVLVELLLEQVELDPQRHEPLLGPVVEIALDPSPLAIGRRDYSRAGPLDLRQGGADPVGQALVLERDERIAGDRLDVLLLVGQGLVMDDRRDGPAAAPDVGHAAARSRCRERKRPAAGVHPRASAAGIGVRDLERRIPEGARQGVAQLLAGERRTDARTECLQGARHVQPPAQQADQERRSHRRQRERDQPRQRIDQLRVGRRGADAHGDRQHGHPCDRHAQHGREGEPHEVGRVAGRGRPGAP